MPGGLQIAPVSAARFEELLPLIAAYQRFYEVEEIDEERNRAFFARFLAPSEDGLLLGARRDGRFAGYACLYWHFSSLRATESVLMNDLFVEPDQRGGGVGRALIEASAAVARERGASHLEWATDPDNRTAQRLYDTTGAERREQLEYDLDV
jgi:GNAT superfamily N-acetyltransferase